MLTLHRHLDVDVVVLRHAPYDPCSLGCAPCPHSEGSDPLDRSGRGVKGGQVHISFSTCRDLLQAVRLLLMMMTWCVVRFFIEATFKLHKHSQAPGAYMQHLLSMYALGGALFY